MLSSLERLSDRRMDNRLHFNSILLQHFNNFVIMSNTKHPLNIYWVKFFSYIYNYNILSLLNIIKFNTTTFIYRYIFNFLSFSYYKVSGVIISYVLYLMLLFLLLQ